MAFFFIVFKALSWIWIVWGKGRYYVQFFPNLVSFWSSLHYIINIILISQMRDHARIMRLTWDVARVKILSNFSKTVFKKCVRLHYVVAQKSCILRWCLAACTPTPSAIPWKGSIPSWEPCFTHFALRELSLALFGSSNSLSLGPGRLWRNCPDAPSDELPAKCWASGHLRNDSARAWRLPV